MPIICKNLYVSQKFFTSIGLSRRLEEIYQSCFWGNSVSLACKYRRFKLVTFSTVLNSGKEYEKGLKHFSIEKALLEFGEVCIQQKCMDASKQGLFRLLHTQSI